MALYRQRRNDGVEVTYTEKEWAEKMERERKERERERKKILDNTPWSELTFGEKIGRACTNCCQVGCGGIVLLLIPLFLYGLYIEKTEQKENTNNENAAQIESVTDMKSWVDFFSSTMSLNDLSYMEGKFEKELTDLKTGKKINYKDYKKEQQNYVNRWIKRQFEVVDYKINDNIIEIRSTYACTNVKGKTVKGFCKTTYQISKNGLIEGFADESSKTNMPEFSL